VCGIDWVEIKQQETLKGEQACLANAGAHAEEQGKKSLPENARLVIKMRAERGTWGRGGDSRVLGGY